MEDEQRESVTRCIKYADDVYDAADDNAEGFAEKRLESDKLIGTLDNLIIDPKASSADIIDAKFGRVPVSPANVNMQGICYSSLVWNNYPEVDRIRVHFLAPRLDLISVCEFTREPHQRLFSARIDRAIARREDPERQPIPNVSTCQFCAVKATCPALSKLGLDVVQQTTLHMPSPEFFRPGGLATPEDRARAQILAVLLGGDEGWCAQVKRANAKAVFEDNIEVPGFTLRQRHGGYSIDCALVILEKIRETYKVDYREIASAITTSIPKLVDALALKFIGADKKEIKLSLLELFDDLVDERETVRYLQRTHGKMEYGEIWEDISEQQGLV
jgi:hypothetical protein